MEGRGSMASYYMQRGIGGSGLLHSPPGFRPMSNPGLPVQSNYGTSSAASTFPVESPASGAANVGVSAGTPTSGEPVKRKRGRPRKYGPDGTMSSVSPTTTSAPAASSAPASSPVLPTPKRGRGRPPGSGSKQQLAALGEWVSGSAGMGFTPHVITIPVGEDVATKIMSFSQQGPRAVCILSANGAVSTATLRQPASSGGIITYEGRFEILCLSGSYLLSDNNGSNSRTGGLSVALSSPDGRVIGGGVGGMLIAASPVQALCTGGAIKSIVNTISSSLARSKFQVMMDNLLQVIAGSFISSRTKMKNKSGAVPESGIDYSHPNGDEKLDTPSGVSHSQNLSPSMGGWPSSRPMDMRSTHTDLDLTHG